MPWSGGQSTWAYTLTTTYACMGYWFHWESKNIIKFVKWHKLSFWNTLTFQCHVNKHIQELFQIISSRAMPKIHQKKQLKYIMQDYKVYKVLIPNWTFCTSSKFVFEFCFQSLPFKYTSRSMLIILIPSYFKFNIKLLKLT
jgi:hypothetical protein